jgi:hypothetical protein
MGENIPSNAASPEFRDDAKSPDSKETPVYKVTVPVDILSLNRDTENETEAFINIIRSVAISQGATYMHFSIIGDTAVFESDSEQFAKGYFQTVTVVLANKLEKMRTACTYSVFPK